MKAIFKLAVCLGALVLFIKISPIIPEYFATYREIVTNSAKMGIDHSALFYSEEPHSLAAEKYLKKQLKANAE